MNQSLTITLHDQQHIVVQATPYPTERCLYAAPGAHIALRLKLADAAPGALPLDLEPPVDRRLWLYGIQGEPCVHVEPCGGDGGTRRWPVHI